MRVMERNKSAYWYLLYDRKEPVKDKEGRNAIPVWSTKRP